MKRLLGTLLVLAVSVTLYAADTFDTIIKTNSEKIEAVIQEVSDSEVRYKKATNPTGPTYVIKTSEIASIIYANGDVQVISHKEQNTISSGGYVFNYPEQAKTQPKPKAKREKPVFEYNWENFFLANYQYGFARNQHAVGLTYGRVKKFGWYTGVGLGTGFNYGYTYRGSRYTHRIDVNGTSTYPFYTGRESHNQVTVTAGAVARLVIPLYVYLGAGYGYQSDTYELLNGQWAMLAGTNRYQGHNVAIEVGLQGNIKGFTLSVGYFTLIGINDNKDGPFHQLKVGIGGMWKDKKK